MSAGVRKSNRQKSMFWKPIPWKGNTGTSTPPVVAEKSAAATRQDNSLSQSTHALVNQTQNEILRSYETETKAKFDDIEPVLKKILSQKQRVDFIRWANAELYSHIGVTLDEDEWELNNSSNSQFVFQNIFAKVVFKQFLAMSEDFFLRDPLGGQRAEEATRIFRDAGIHAVGVAPCADGRLAHFVSYVMRLPYTLARRKSHAGAMFDVSESVRNWVFTEHTRFREGLPNSADEPTRYMKMAVYHFSKADPTHQGCAAHGSDEYKAGSAALKKLNDFRQAIENRFGANSKVETFLIGVNTDDDSLKFHIPDQYGQVSLDRFMDTAGMYQATMNLPAEEAMVALKDAIDFCNKANQTTLPRPEIRDLIAWLIANNFSQIAYVKSYESGCYDDIGHAERFIGIGNGFEEVQLRNLSYYSYLHTIEEGVNDVDVGIKIFKGLNVKKGVPIPIIIRCDYDGRVPGSKTRAVEKAKRLEKAVQSRYHELYACGLVKTMGTLRDYTGFKPAEKLRTL